MLSLTHEQQSPVRQPDRRVLPEADVEHPRAVLADDDHVRLVPLPVGDAFRGRVEGR